MSDEFDKPIYEIGYKKPPKGSQFKKGQSGNSKGRPKGSLNFSTEIDRELASKVTIKENGRSKKVTKKRIIAKQLVNKAVNGDLKASGMLINQANLNEQNQQAKVSGVPENFVEEDEMVLASFFSRIREVVLDESKDALKLALYEQPTENIEAESGLGVDGDINANDDIDKGYQSW